jgi:acyl-coenzyme A thioesterase PaaI-like protein
VTEPETSPTTAEPQAFARAVPDPDVVRATLFHRWQEPAVEDLTPRHLEMRRLAASMRAIIERLVATDAPEAAIVEAADELARVALAFDRFAPEKRYEGFSEATLAGGDPRALFEHSPFIGLANPLAPPIQLREVDGAVHGTATFGSAYEGPPGCVHGGYIAGAFDEVLGATQTLSGQPGMTGTLSVKYRRPTPLHHELQFVGELVRVEGRKIFTQGRLLAGGVVCAEAEAVFVSIDVERFVALRRQREDAERARHDQP